MRLTNGMASRNGLCPFTWLSIDSLCEHLCWHPEGHPGCHNCEWCGKSTRRPSWEFEQLQKAFQPRIEVKPDPVPDPVPDPPKKRRQTPRPKKDTGPCQYMFFSLHTEDYAPHVHECRRITGHKEKHVCCRCGYRVERAWREREPRIETPRTWKQQRQYLATTPLRTVRFFDLDSRVLRAVERAELVTPKTKELLSGPKVTAIDFKKAARYRRFVHQRRAAGALLVAMIGLDMIGIPSEGIF